MSVEGLPATALSDSRSAQIPDRFTSMPESQDRNIIVRRQVALGRPFPEAGEGLGIRIARSGRRRGMTASRQASSRSALRRVPTALVVVAGAVALLLGSASPALAHDGLVGTRPASGSTVPGMPPAVELDFTGEPLPLGTLVAVTGPDGAPVSSGDAEIRGTTVVQPIDDGAAGPYRVEWRSTSSDGHPLSGTFDFTVAEGDAAPPPAATSPASADAPADATAEADGGIAPVWPAAGAVVLVGLGAVTVTRLRRRG
jgi:copper resistance protein C